MNRFINFKFANKKSENIFDLKIFYRKFTLPCDAAMLE